MKHSPQGRSSSSPARRPPGTDDAFAVHPTPVVTSETAAALGATGTRGRGRGVAVPSRGLRQRRGDSATGLQWAVAHAQQDPGLVVSHITAAELWGIWLPRRLEGAAHLTRLRGPRAAEGGVVGTRPRRPGVRGHLQSIPDDHVHVVHDEHGDWRVTDAVWTWAELGGCGLGLEELVIAGDALLRRADGPRGEAVVGKGHPLSCVTDLRAVLEARGRLRGKRLLTEALELVRSGSDSPTESRLRLRLVEAGFPEPELNGRVLLGVEPDGWEDWSGPKDLLWRRWRIAVEYEGAHHLELADQYRRDMRRDEAMRERGWIVLRVDRDVWTRAGWMRSVERLRSAFVRQGA